MGNKIIPFHNGKLGSAKLVRVSAARAGAIQIILSKKKATNKKERPTSHRKMNNVYVAAVICACHIMQPQSTLKFHRITEHCLRPKQPHQCTMINCTRAGYFTPKKSPLTSHPSLPPLTLNSHPHSDSHSHSPSNPSSHSQYDRKSSHSLRYSSTTENLCFSICFGSIPLFEILWYDRKSLVFVSRCF